MQSDKFISIKPLPKQNKKSLLFRQLEQNTESMSVQSASRFISSARRLLNSSGKTGCLSNWTTPIGFKKRAFPLLQLNLARLQKRRLIFTTRKHTGVVDWAAVTKSNREPDICAQPRKPFQEGEMINVLQVKGD